MNEDKSNPKETIAKITMELKFLKEELKEIKEKVPTKDEMRLVMREEIDKFVKTCDEKYADQKQFSLVQKLVFVFYAMLVLGALSAIGYIIKSHLGIK